MEIPGNLLYTKEHEWIRMEGNNAVIGITAHAQSELGDIVYVEVNTVGESLSKDSVFGTVEAVKTVADLFMPVSGEVLEFNATLENNPEAVNKDPYGEGWMVKIRLTDPSETSALLSAQQYKDITGS